jgi:hypothetical protein
MTQRVLNYGKQVLNIKNNKNEDRFNTKTNGKKNNSKRFTLTEAITHYI